MNTKNVQQSADIGNAAVVVHQHHHHYAAAPLVIAEKSAEQAGISAKTLRKLARQGLKYVRTPDGITVLASDLESFMRARGEVLGTKRDQGEQSHPRQAGPDAALARAGLKLIGGAR